VSLQLQTLGHGEATTKSEITANVPVIRNSIFLRQSTKIKNTF